MYRVGGSEGGLRSESSRAGVREIHDCTVVMLKLRRGPKSKVIPVLGAHTRQAEEARHTSCCPPLTLYVYGAEFARFGQATGQTFGEMSCV